MAKATTKTVTEYIASFPRDKQRVLREVRRALRDAVPDGEEVISYQIPALKCHGTVFFYAAWKEHYSLYPITGSLMTRFGDKLKERAGEKGTIKFPYAEPVPVKLIAAMAKFRAAENRRASAAKTKTKAKTKSSR